MIIHKNIPASEERLNFNSRGKNNVKDKLRNKASRIF